MRKRLYKIAGIPASNGLNSCPTVTGFGETDVILQAPSSTARRAPG